MTFGTLTGKKGLVVGIANDRSIAWACAQAFHEAGAGLAATWQTEKTHQYVGPLFEQIGVDIARPLDVGNDEEMQTLFDEIGRKWGRLDFLLHSIAFAPRDDLHGRVTDSSREGFLTAMDLSCHSFVRMARLAEPLMKHGGSLMTMSFLGSQEVVPNYGLMGPVKAALESTVRYLAAELGPSGIRVNAVSPGPIATRAASGLANLDALIDDSVRRSAMHQPLSIDDVGPLCAFLAGDGARAVTGMTIYVDGGYHILK